MEPPEPLHQVRVAWVPVDQGWCCLEGVSLAQTLSLGASLVGTCPMALATCTPPCLLHKSICHRLLELGLQEQDGWLQCKWISALWAVPACTATATAGSFGFSRETQGQKLSSIKTLSETAFQQGLWAYSKSLKAHVGPMLLAPSSLLLSPP